jgi:hypothetical protein
MEANPLDPIRHQINAGDREGAKTALAELLEGQPDNADAWALLAILLTDPAEQAQCYCEILRIDPNDRQAAIWLESLSAQSEEPPEAQSVARDSGRRECPRCGGMIAVSPLEGAPRSAAICPYCGYALEPADISGESGPALEHKGSSDDAEEEMEWIPEGVDLDQLLDTLPLPGTVDETQASAHRPATPPRPVGRKGLLNGLLGRLRRETSDTQADDLVMSQVEASSAAGALTPDLILQLAGGPLAPEERRECPTCGAVVSRLEKKCPWCSAPLPELEDGQVPS